MKNNILAKLLFTKIALLLFSSYKRQKYVDELNAYIEECLLEFDGIEIKKIRKQMSYLSDEECDNLFSESFPWYDFFKFKKTRLKIDNYNPEDCRTYSQFNRVIKLCFVAMDYEKNLHN